MPASRWVNSVRVIDGFAVTLCRGSGAIFVGFGFGLYPVSSVRSVRKYSNRRDVMRNVKKTLWSQTPCLAKYLRSLLHVTVKKAIHIQKLRNIVPKNLRWPHTYPDINREAFRTSVLHPSDEEPPTAPDHHPNAALYPPRARSGPTPYQFI